MNLFQTGQFTLASGEHSSWKIECDRLTTADWDALAAMAVPFLPPFAACLGVPRGGLPLARSLEKHASPYGKTIICDDVWTTGGSMRRFIEQWKPENYLGLVVFARNPPEPWVTTLFQMPTRRYAK